MGIKYTFQEKISGCLRYMEYFSYILYRSFKSNK